MAAALPHVLSAELQKRVNECKLLMVGAGGIGCELLKNLVLTGFKNIEVIDLDTIDVSNLNRQFLFRKEHVGKSKSLVAKNSALSFNPETNIVAYHDSITSSEYGTNFFRKFDIVMNALDNRAARNHVNRMCLAADIPLVESGTAGYLGQVTVIKKSLTECYECQPKPRQKTFPGCTIRNTPSEPIHCIVWSKHLFNQLFGEEDPDQDVSPDTEDPELAGDAGESAMKEKSSSDAVGAVERKSTRAWAMESGYDPQKLFNKLFRDDIKYLLSMETLWKKRKPPIPLDWENLPDTAETGTEEAGIRDQRLWTIKECCSIFSNCLKGLKDELSKQGEGGMLVWDKDDMLAMDFVTCTANIRAYIFGIAQKTRFDIKSMAGNIIPAIATTNAVIAGLIVMEGLKILNGEIEKCKTVYLNRQPNPRKKLLVPCTLDKPNPKCYVCVAKPEATVVCNTDKITIRTLEDKILKVALGMVAPDVEIDDGKGTIVISSEEGETEDNADKMLSEFGINNGSRLKCDDFLQNYTLVLNIAHRDKLEEDKEFEVVGDMSELQAKEEEEEKCEENKEDNQTKTNDVSDDEDLMVVDEPEEEMICQQQVVSRKRKAEDDLTSTDTPKKVKVSDTQDADEDDIVVL